MQAHTVHDLPILLNLSFPLSKWHQDLCGFLFHSFRGKTVIHIKAAHDGIKHQLAEEIYYLLHTSGMQI